MLPTLSVVHQATSFPLHAPALLSGHQSHQHQPSASEWQRIRPVFYELYINQNLPLKDVKELLKGQYGFHATQKMFKDRIRRWNLGKNIRTIEAQAAIRQVQKRGAQGKRTQIVIRGKEVYMDNLLRHLDRAGVAPTGVEDGRQSTTPTGVHCLTPPHHSPIPQSNRARLRESDQWIAPSHIPTLLVGDCGCPLLLNCIMAYYQGADWVTGPKGIYIPDHYPCALASTSPQRPISPDKYPRESILLRLEQASSIIRMFIVTRDPRLLIHILESLSACMQAGFTSLATQLVGYFAHMCQLVLGPNHPTTIFTAGVFRKIFELESDQFHAGLKYAIDQFRYSIGQPHRRALEQKLAGCTILTHSKSRIATTMYSAQLLELYRAPGETKDCDCCSALLDRALFCAIDGNCSDARRLILLAMKIAEGILDPLEQVESRTRCLVSLAKLQSVEGDKELVVHNLKLALTLGGEQLSDDHWIMIDARAVLEQAEQETTPSTVNGFE